MNEDFLDLLIALNAAEARFLVVGAFVPLADLKEEDLATPGTGFKMGLPPRRIDILTKISGVEFAQAWPRRVETEFAPGVRCHVIAVADLLANSALPAARRTSPTWMRWNDFSAPSDEHELVRP